MNDRSARHFAELLAVLRQRVLDLNLTYEAVDDLAGLPTRSTAKILCDPPLRRASPFVLVLVVQALGLKLLVTEDAEQMQLMQTRLQRSQRAKPRAIRSVSTKTVSIHLAPDFMKQIQRKGGYARASKLTPLQRSKAARKAVLARWQKHRQKLAAAA
jgi:hypothetical protein